MAKLYVAISGRQLPTANRYLKIKNKFRHFVVNLRNLRNLLAKVLNGVSGFGVQVSDGQPVIETSFRGQVPKNSSDSADSTDFGPETQVKKMRANRTNRANGANRAN